MKKLIISILFIICLAFGISAFAACGNSGGIGGNNIPTENQYNENITYKLSYTSEEECPNGNISDNKLHSSLNFEVDKTYYMVMDFKISSFERSAWGGSFNSTVKIFPLETISATLEEAATGNMSEKTENGGTIITTTYSIPENRGEEKTYRVTFQMKIRSEGLINIGILFYGDNENAENAHLDEISFGVNVTAGLKYTLNSDGKSYSVLNIGTAKDNEIKIPTLNWGLPITSIKSNAFEECTNLTNITIPDSVTSIGGGAFEDTAYYNNPDNWTNDVLYIGNFLIDAKDTLSGSYEINQSTKLIADYAFKGCRITSITIPDSVTSIGRDAFSGYNTKLKSVYITDIAAWCNIDFGSYNANPLYSAHNLYLDSQLVTNLNMLDGITEIKDCAFDGFGGTSITIPDSVTSIGQRAFSDCASLESVTIGNGVTSIGWDAFRGCYNLTSITIPDSVTSIGGGAFYNCANLQTINIPNGMNYIPQEAFAACFSLTSITIPDSVTYIGNEAFYNCENLENITIGNSVTSIGDSAFEYCESLTSINIPDSVTFIGIWAFSGCASLANVTFENPNGWYYDYSSSDLTTSGNIPSIDLNNPATAAQYLAYTYARYYWTWKTA